MENTEALPTAWRRISAQESVSTLQILDHIPGEDQLITRDRTLPLFFCGTVIDIETSGLLPESAEIVTLGTISGNHLRIVQRTDERNFHGLIISLLERLPRPFYAFNKRFEEEMLGVKIDLELQSKPYERKKEAIAIAGLQDPFDGLGHKVPDAWDSYMSTGNDHYLRLIMDHNETCLLLETCLALARSDTSRITSRYYNYAVKVTQKMEEII